MATGWRLGSGAHGIEDLNEINDVYYREGRDSGVAHCVWYLRLPILLTTKYLNILLYHFKSLIRQFDNHAGHIIIYIRLHAQLTDRLTLIVPGPIKFSDILKFTLDVIVVVVEPLKALMLLDRIV